MESFKWLPDIPAELLCALGNPAVHTVTGSSSQTLDQLQAMRDHLQVQAMAAVLLRSDYRGETDPHRRFDYRVVVDRGDVVAPGLGPFWMGNIKLRQYDFLFSCSILPGFRAVHLHDLSIGRAESVERLEGKGFVSKFMGSLAAKLEANVPGYTVIGTPIEMHLSGFRVMPHLLRKYFDADFMSIEQTQEMMDETHLYIDAVDRGMVMKGHVRSR